MAEEKYNRKTTAVKRILQEMKEMQSNAYDDFMNLPLEIHQYMFSKPPIVPPLSLPLTIDEQPIAPLSEDPQTNPTSSEAVAPVEQPPVPETDRPVEDVRELHLNAAAVHIQYHDSVKC
ncbi:ubiquitin-conjugating enzyme [Musa troglodytarum]|uniref:Ubiquitin-conjugating enzyme n=1 Tax=Musa troglodytarum TaxID=320322 RepID=A0A9E7KI16_9LILI|nr:ubiquitin-conjugating enzyme [Musa troglodytarum]